MHRVDPVRILLDHLIALAAANELMILCEDSVPAGIFKTQLVDHCREKLVSCPI
jgi:hypothetical protein